MTRSIHRGVPYPAHGRAIDYTGLHSIADFQGRLFCQDLGRATMSIYRTPASLIGKIERQLRQSLPELAAKAQQE